MTNKSFLVNEMFTSIQGEGPKTGVLSLFIRLAGCNLRCADCDSKHSWVVNPDSKEVTPFTPYELALAIDSRRQHTKFSNIVITGGEPMIQQDLLEEFLLDFTTYLYRYSFEIETNGAIPYNVDIANKTSFNISPKLAAFTQLVGQERYTLDSLYSYTIIPEHKVAWKFVVSPMTIESDLEEIKTIAYHLSISPRHIFLMPRGINADEQAESARFLLDICNETGYNLSLRTHIIIWGGKRGV